MLLYKEGARGSRWMGGLCRASHQAGGYSGGHVASMGGGSRERWVRQREGWGQQGSALAWNNGWVMHRRWKWVGPAAASRSRRERRQRGHGLPCGWRHAQEVKGSGREEVGAGGGFQLSWPTLSRTSRGTVSPKVSPKGGMQAADASLAKQLFLFVRVEGRGKWSVVVANEGRCLRQRTVAAKAPAGWGRQRSGTGPC